MQLRVRHSRLQPWWLMVGLLAALSLLCTVSSAPAGNLEAQRPPIREIESPPTRFNIPFANDADDIAEERYDAFRPRGASFSSTRRFIEVSPSTSPVRTSRIRQSVERLRQKTSSTLQAAKDRLARWSESRRANRTQRLQSRETEIPIVFKQTEDELKALNMPKDRPQIDVGMPPRDNTHLEPHRKIQYEHYVQGISLTEDEAKAELARQGRSIRLSSSARELSIPVSSPKVVGLEAAKTLPAQDKLGRTPSSAWDASFISWKAKARSGTSEIVEATDEAIHRLHKRAPPNDDYGFVSHPPVRYPGTSWVISRSPNNNDVTFHMRDPALDHPVIPKRWDELREADRRQLLKLEPRLDRAVRSNFQNAEQHLGLGDFPNSVRRFIPGKEAQHIAIRQRGNEFQFEYDKPRFMRESKRKWVSAEKLPDHLREYLRKYVQSDIRAPWASVVRGLRKRSLPLVKRAGSESSSANPYRKLGEAYHFPGEVVDITKVAGDHAFAFPITYVAEPAIQSSAWDELPGERKERVRAVAPRIDAYLNGEVSAREAGLDFKPMRGLPDAKELRLHLDGPGGQTVWVERKRDPAKLWLTKKPIFGRLDPTTSRLTRSSWSELPAYLQDWFRTEHADIWREAEGLKRRSLFKRAGPSSSSATVPGAEILRYPGEIVEIHRGDTGEHFFSFPIPTRPSAHSIYTPFHELPLEQQTRVARAIPKIREFVSGAVGAEDAELNFKNSGLGHRPVAKVNLDGPAGDTIWVKRKKNWLGGKKVKFYRLDPETAAITKSDFEGLPRHLRVWIQDAHPEVFREVVKRRLARRSLPSISRDHEKRADNEQPLELHYPGEHVVAQKGPAGVYRFHLPSSSSSSSRVNFQQLHELTLDARANVMLALPKIRRVIEQPSLERDAGFHFAPDPNRPGHRILRRPIPGMGEETILVTRKKSLLSRIVPGKSHLLLFTRIDPDTGEETASTFKELPDHIQRWFQKTQPRLFEEVLSHHRLLRRAGGSSSSSRLPRGTVTTVNYPGQKILMYRDYTGRFRFSLPPAGFTGNAVRSADWSGLHDEVKNAWRRTHPHIRKLAKGDYTLAQAQQKAASHGLPAVQLGDRADDWSKAYDWPGRQRETISIWRNSANEYMFERRAANGQLVGTQKWSQLPSHLQDYLWVKEDLRSIVEGAAGVVRRFR